MEFSVGVLLWRLRQTPTMTLPSSMCPITLELMADPCIAADGHSYERTSLERWFEHSSLSPVTGKVLLHRCIVPNHALRNLITESSGRPEPSSWQLHDRSAWDFMPSQQELRRVLLGAALHALLHIVFRFPDVDLALSYACLGQDHGALLVYASLSSNLFTHLCGQELSRSSNLV
eukprot:1353642-Prymnesium_polylepis.1